MNDNKYDKYTSYTIHWTAKVLGWQPLELPTVDSPAPVEQEITDFTEANKVLAKIMAL